MLAFRILHPAWFQNLRARPPYFEGWYFKLISADGAHRLAFIPGMTRGMGGGGPHAFIQVFDGTGLRTAYYRFPLEAFRPAPRAFDLAIGEQRFGERGLRLDLRGEGIDVRGELAFGPLTPWPVTLTAPGIMGWYAWLPWMECYHGVLSLDHTLHGSLDIDGQRVDFSGGRGYIEKDWGRSFPQAWIWLQSNHFETPGTSLIASVARIPWLGRAFPGFIVGIRAVGQLYRFATYTGARLADLQVDERRVYLVVEDARYRLAIEAWNAPGVVLRGPRPGDMGRDVAETLQARVTASLSDRRTGQTLFQGTGQHAGLEIHVPDLRLLLPAS